MGADPLLQRSVRTLAWLGDAAFEREVRWRIASRGDFPVDRLDAMKTDVVCAAAQAELLSLIEPELTEPEQDAVRRGRNAKSPPRARTKTEVYRASTAFEALVAHWALTDGAWGRFEAVVVPHLERSIEAAAAKRARKPKRG